MSIIFFLIPLGLLLLAIAVGAFIWAVNNDQFDDLDRAGQSILFDDDEVRVESSPDDGSARDSGGAPEGHDDDELP